MQLIGVITGDLIDSTKVAEAGAFKSRLETLLGRVEQRYGASAAMYRGDGFQVTLERPVDAYEAAIAVRAGLVAGSPGMKQRWDARIAVAFGMAELPAAAREQNSEVHVHSGQALDSMDKERFRLILRVDRPEFGVTADLVALFVDDLINDWTPREAEMILDHLMHRDGHLSTARRLGVSRPTVTLALQRAKSGLVDAAIRDMTRLTELAYDEQPD